MEKDKRKRSPDERKKNPTLGDDEDASKSRRRSKKSKVGRDDSKDLKSKNRKHKSHHKSSHAKEKKSRDKHKVASRRHGAHPPQDLSLDDYFSKNNEFATWLKEEKSLFFSDLSSESARDLFSDFVKQWNTNKLDSRYYEGIATGPRTSHKWNIK